MNYFDITRNYLKETLDSPTFSKWIEPLSYIGMMNQIVFVGSPDPQKTEWIKSNLLEKLNQYMEKEFQCSMKLVPLYEEDELPAANSQEKSDPAREPGNFISNLNPKYTFDTFVQLDSNRMAYSFAYSVSEFPGKSYNPLYIYSDVGLGKTHLMYAIGNRIQLNSDMKVVYLTSSDFMYEYVEYTRFNKRSEFIHKYTSVDVLLIDDIQYITKWGGTSEQFYYVFNKLIQEEKQIVLCSDTHPDNIPYLENRIKSRFEWGGIVDILPYDLEGRMAILKQKLSERKKQGANHFDINEEVLYFLASSIKENIRKLEGALNRLIGFAELKHTDTNGDRITLDFAKEALKPIISLARKQVTVESIQEYVAKRYNIRTEDLKSRNNSPRVAHPRQIAMFVCKRATRHSLAEIGHQFGGKHHTTVLHSIKRVEERMQTDAEFSKNVKAILNFFNES
ncbi:MAG: chromosomal replication initiator protein DnaA [Acidobacteriota bacterium]|jgi:chromosomal replication initiator protein|nr:chromosomal replication initiator protein DnaA [Acidobacteriota bacterium]